MAKFKMPIKCYWCREITSGDIYCSNKCREDATKARGKTMNKLASFLSGIAKEELS